MNLAEPTGRCPLIVTRVRANRCLSLLGGCRCDQRIVRIAGALRAARALLPPDLSSPGLDGFDLKRRARQVGRLCLHRGVDAQICQSAPNDSTREP